MLPNTLFLKVSLSSLLKFSSSGSSSESLVIIKALGKNRLCERLKVSTKLFLFLGPPPTIDVIKLVIIFSSPSYHSWSGGVFGRLAD